MELFYYLRYARGIALGVHQQREHVLSRLVCGLLVKSEFVLDRRGQQVALWKPSLDVVEFLFKKILNIL